MNWHPTRVRTQIYRENSGWWRWRVFDFFDRLIEEGREKFFAGAEKKMIKVRNREQSKSRTQAKRLKHVRRPKRRIRFGSLRFFAPIS